MTCARLNKRRFRSGAREDFKKLIAGLEAGKKK
jgi:hypothetical protein